MGPALGSVLAAGFYKFIKVLEYETANPGQDLDHAANIENKKQLLVAAGLPHMEATIVAQDLAQQPVTAQAGGIDEAVMANGRGRASHEVDPAGMYGSQFASEPKVGNDRQSSTSGDTIVTRAASRENLPQRPQAITTGSSVGRLAYLRDAARRASVTNEQSVRMESPAMATHDEIYHPLSVEPNVSLGYSVQDNDARARFGRTISSGV